MSAVLNAIGVPQEIRTPDSQPRPLTRTVGPLRREPGEPGKRRADAPRPTKMGTIRFAVALRCGRLLRAPGFQSATDCDFALRPVGVSRAARPPRVPKRRDRPRCDIAHQPDLGHIPSVGERFCDDRELAPA